MQGWEFAHQFSEQITRFLRKNEQFAHLLIFGEWPERFAHGPERIAHGHSFLVSNLSDSLTYLIKKEGMSESLVFLNKKTYIKRTKNMILVKKIWVNRSFAQLSWATWANRSQSLFWYERPERITHSRSFVLSDLSEALTVAHLIWAIWANKRRANERIPNPEF